MLVYEFLLLRDYKSINIFIIRDTNSAGIRSARLKKRFTNQEFFLFSLHAPFIYSGGREILHDLHLELSRSRFNRLQTSVLLSASTNATHAHHQHCWTFETQITLTNYIVILFILRAKGHHRWTIAWSATWTEHGRVLWQSVARLTGATECNESSIYFLSSVKRFSFANIYTDNKPWNTQ